MKFNWIVFTFIAVSFAADDNNDEDVHCADELIARMPDITSKAQPPAVLEKWCKTEREKWEKLLKNEGTGDDQRKARRPGKQKATTPKRNPFKPAGRGSNAKAGKWTTKKQNYAGQKQKNRG